MHNNAKCLARADDPFDRPFDPHLHHLTGGQDARPSPFLYRCSALDSELDNSF